ncbi:MAG: S8 family serine peptidase [Bacteroidia bacterium]|nr:S8 family serine peptidase [Bacteroidia bacterium]
MKIAFTLLLLSAANCLYGQGSTYYYYYRVYFRDKGENATGNYAPGDLISPRAMYRRQKSGIPVPDFRDIPVYTGYLNQISSSVFKLHCTSKWMNTALFKTQSPADINILLDLSFVSDVKIVKTPGYKNNFIDKHDFQIEQADLPPFDRPIAMVNGYPLHNSGYDGKGVLIAILDGGFIIADQISSLNDLRNRNGIKATYDFVNNNKSVYSNSSHGTAVLSVLAGKIPGSIEGTAPGADYLLLKTEDVESEFPCEEDFWAAGAEFADSAGADIISSSLGYYDFNDPTLNYKYSDLDGNTAFVTRAADIAASKGILVVNSAGNERNKNWKRIIFPSDGDSVLAVGAVDGNNIISTFSSAGPSADGRIKPDISTMGVSVPVQTALSLVDRSNGTSFSCPVLSGMAACLMQAVPMALNTDVIEALHSSGDRHNSPDSLYGYGIPDMVDALTMLKLLQNFLLGNPDKETVAGPNPFTDDIEIAFRLTPGQFKLEIFTISGNLVAERNYPDYFGRTLLITELRNKEEGIYIIRIITGYGTFTHKVIKLKN